MNKCDINALLHRVNTCAHFKKLMADFETNKFNLIYKKGIYVYGPPGAGKTHFVISTLEQMGYDVIQYDASDVKNTIIFENIINNGMSLNNIMGSFTRTEKKIVIVMDEIDAMAAGDKGCISNIIKLIRPNLNHGLLSSINLIRSSPHDHLYHPDSHHRPNRLRFLSRLNSGLLHSMRHVQIIRIPSCRGPVNC